MGSASLHALYPSSDPDLAGLSNPAAVLVAVVETPRTYPRPAGGAIPAAASAAVDSHLCNMDTYLRLAGGAIPAAAPAAADGNLCTYPRPAGGAVPAAASAAGDSHLCNMDPYVPGCASSASCGRRPPLRRRSPASCCSP